MSTALLRELLGEEGLSKLSASGLSGPPIFKKLVAGVHGKFLSMLGLYDSAKHSTLLNNFLFLFFFQFIVTERYQGPGMSH